MDERVYVQQTGGCRLQFRSNVESLTRTEEQGILGELEGEFSRGRAGGSVGSSWDISNKGGTGTTEKKTEGRQKGGDPQVADTGGNKRTEVGRRDRLWGVNEYRGPERQPQSGDYR